MFLLSQGSASPSCNGGAGLGGSGSPLPPAGAAPPETRKLVVSSPDPVQAHICSPLDGELLQPFPQGSRKALEAAVCIPSDADTIKGIPNQMSENVLLVNVLKPQILGFFTCLV